MPCYDVCIHGVFQFNYTCWRYYTHVYTNPKVWAISNHLILLFLTCIPSLNYFADIYLTDKYVHYPCLTLTWLISLSGWMFCVINGHCISFRLRGEKWDRNVRRAHYQVIFSFVIFWLNNIILLVYCRFPSSKCLSLFLQAAFTALQSGK